MTTSTGAGDGRRLSLTATPLDQDRFDARYLRRRDLGRGGMGEVDLLRDERIGRDVARKRLRRDAEGATPGASRETVSAERLERFLREARIQAQLDHPAIVPVYDLGVDADGTPYFTMKPLRGATLAEIIDRHRRGDAEALRRFGRRKLLADLATVCLAIELAHQSGVVHRDLKPSNLMLGDFGEVYVLDWGLAKVVGEADPVSGPGQSVAGSGDSTETRAGVVLGTPGYMAPEQHRGDPDAIDGRTDVYALGAILFELLTLERLHAASSKASTMLADAAAPVDPAVDQAVDAPSHRTPDREIAPELDAICLRAIAPEPGARFASAAALHEALDAYLAGDRDVERRRELAGRHLDNARAASARLLAGSADDDDAHATAVREAGRAVALDPDHPEAAALLSRLLVEAPRTIPAEVEARLEADHLARVRAGVKATGPTFLGLFLFVPLVLSLGVRDQLTFVLLGVLVLAMGIAGLAARGRLQWWHVDAVSVLQAVMLMVMTRLFGPLVTVPTAVAAMVYINIGLSPRRWGLQVALGFLAIGVPLALEHLGVLARSYTVEHGVMMIHPHLMTFSSDLALLFLALAALVSPLAGVPLLLHGHAAADRARRRLAMQAWQLEQISQTPRQVAASSP